MFRPTCCSHIITITILYPYEFIKTSSSPYNPLSYTITGGAARHEKVKPKTWRIFTFADDNWYHHHGYWYHQLPLTRLISEPATIFTPPWFFQNNFRCFLFFARFSVNTCCFWYFRYFFDLWLLCQRCERRFLCYSRLLKTIMKLFKPQETLGDLVYI